MYCWELIDSYYTSSENLKKNPYMFREKWRELQYHLLKYLPVRFLHLHHSDYTVTSRKLACRKSLRFLLSALKSLVPTKRLFV